MSSKKKWDFLKFLILIAIVLVFFYLIMLYFHGVPVAENTSKSKVDQKHLIEKKSENDVMSSNFTEEDLDKLSKIRIKAQQFKDINSTSLKTVYVKKPGLQPGVNGALFCYCDFYRLQRVASICSQ